MFDADLRAAFAAPFGLTIEILVDPVMFEQPIALACVTRQHLTFDRKRFGHIDEEIDRVRVAVAVVAFESVDVIEMRNAFERSGGLPKPRLVVRNRSGEAGVADEEARHFVVGHVVDRGRGHDQVGTDSAEEFDDSTPGRIVVEDREIAELQAMTIRADQGRRRLGFLTTNRRDRRGIVLGAPAVAGSHRRDRDMTPGFRQQGERPRALKLDVVGVGMDRENADRVGHRRHFPRIENQRRYARIIVGIESDASPRRRWERADIGRDDDPACVFFGFGPKCRTKGFPCAERFRISASSITPVEFAARRPRSWCVGLSTVLPNRPSPRSIYVECCPKRPSRATGIGRSRVAPPTIATFSRDNSSSRSPESIATETTRSGRP